MDPIIECLQSSVASILESIGFKSSDTPAFNLICSLVINFLSTLGYDTRKLTENSNRNITNLTDIKYMLLLKGVNVYEIRDVLIRPCAPVKHPADIPKTITKPLSTGMYCYEEALSNLFKFPASLPQIPEPYTIMSTPCYRPSKLTLEEKRRQAAERARQLEEAYARILLAQVSDERAPMSLFPGSTEFMLPVVPNRQNASIDGLLRGSGFEVDKPSASTANVIDDSNQSVYLKKPSFPQL